MRPLLLGLVLVLSACSGGGPSAGSGLSEGESAFASVSSAPAPETFSVARGDSTTLRVSVTRKSPEVAQLELSTVLGPEGIDVSPSAYTFDFEEANTETWTLDFEVSVDPAIGNPEPHFYIYARALDNRGRPVGGETLRLKYQWAL